MPMDAAYRCFARVSGPRYFRAVGLASTGKQIGRPYNEIPPQGGRESNQPLRPQRDFDLAENPRQPVRPFVLAGWIGNQILADFDA